MIETYKKQVHLLLSVLDVALEDERFALKGGTAINLFYRDLPRYSVDIDLCYLPLEDRATSMGNIHAILPKISAEIRKLPRLTVTSSRPLDGRREAKLQAEDHEVRIKIEPNYILRGHLFPTRDMSIATANFCKVSSATFLTGNSFHTAKSASFQRSDGSFLISKK